MSNDAERCADDLIDELRSENARLRGIIERAKEWTRSSFNEAKLIEILNEAGKGNEK
jgi:hypothetical protein